jgi:hypothetical protein
MKMVEPKEARARKPKRMVFGFSALAWLAIGLGPAAASDANSAGENQSVMQDSSLLSGPNVSKDAPLGATPGATGVVFHPEGRAVSNWQADALENLELSAETKAKLTGGADASFVPRCVKLNNYWCIKRARWAGEIAADAEGHVAFASAFEGAVAAAMLLRRYYLDYNRRSALAIVSRWAPAQCAGVTAGFGRPRKPRVARLAALDAIAPRGIQNTLRARWLASHPRGFSKPGDTTAQHHSIVPVRNVAMMRAPEIAIGMGEAERAPIKIAALDFAAPPPSRAGAICTDETSRIQSYARRAIEGIAASPNDDLNLFPAGGSPSANLLRLLENMAKVEIGPLAPRAGLIAAAVARLGSKHPKPVPVDSGGAPGASLRPDR